MRKVIASLNMRLDGYCDHTLIDADEELHDHFTSLLSQGSSILYGRITFQLMEYWRTLIENPSGEQSLDEFAAIMNQIPKVVFSRTLTDTGWDTATLAQKELEQEVRELKQQPGSPILAGSRSIIQQLLKLGLVDELQICLHPVIAGRGQPLFETAEESVTLNLLKSLPMTNGAVNLIYQPGNLP